MQIFNFNQQQKRELKPRSRSQSKSQSKSIPFLISILSLSLIFNYISPLAIKTLDVNNNINTKQVQAADDPTTEPLIQKSDLIYQGAFRVPKGKLGTTTYSKLASGGSAIAYNPVRNSLFIIGHPYEKLLFEISIPDIINTSNINELKTAQLLQTPVDITNGNWNNLKMDGTAIGNSGRPGGFLLFNGKLIGSAYAYYDGGYEGYRSHFTASPNWGTTGTNFQGMYRVGISPICPTCPNGGFVGGYMALIPPEWRSALGGPALTGKGALAIVSRTSFGPCAWVFNPDDIGSKDPVPATMLVGYPDGHTTLGTHHGPSPYFNGATHINGLVFPYGTSSVLFFGRYGYGKDGNGTLCYGAGTSDQSLDGTVVPGTSGHVIYCYDPVDNTKGCHAYPYVYRAWVYDANDLLKVKKGEINPQTGEPYKPWDIKPYALWDLDFPFAIDNANIVGAAYDPATQRIFISEANADKPGPYDTYPLIQVYKVNIPSTPTPDTTPPTLSNGSPSGTLSANTTSTTLSITTNENATCKYSTTANTSYDSVTNTFTTTGGTSHSTTITGLTNGSSYTYYVRCQDTAGNANTTDYPISFNIANSTPTYTITNFISLITHWLGIGDQDSDVNNDGIVNARDLGIMMHYWK